MEFRPALRADLGRVMGAAGELLALHDPLLDRRVNVGPLSRAVAAHLDGRRTVDEIVAAVCAGPLPGAAAGSAPRPAEVEGALRALLLMSLLEGTGEWVLERARQVRAGTPLPIVVPEGTRFGCQGSGDCCRSYTLGPLTDDDHGRILAGEAALRAALPQLAGQPLIEERHAEEAQGGAPRRYLRTVAHRCIFLLPSERCGVHATLGEDWKPGFCRLYPYQDLPTLMGLKLYDGGECASFGVSARCGPFLEDDVGRVLRLLPAQQDLHHPLVFLPLPRPEGEAPDGDEDDGGGHVPCDYGHLLKLQEALTARALGTAAGRDGPERAAEMLAALGRMTRRFVRALVCCPLEAGEPERGLAAAFADGGAPRPDEAEEEAAAARRGRGALRALAEALRDEIAPSVALAGYNTAFPFHFRGLVELDGVLERLLGAAETPDGPETTDAPAPAAQRPRSLPVLGAPAPAPGAIDEAWRRSLGYQVFGRGLLLQDRPVAGLLRLGTIFLVGSVATAMAAAGHSPAPAPATAPTLADFNAGHHLALRALTQGSLEKVFLRFEAHAFDAALALPLWDTVPSG